MDRFDDSIRKAFFNCCWPQDHSRLSAIFTTSTPPYVTCIHLFLSRCFAQGWKPRFWWCPRIHHRHNHVRCCSHSEHHIEPGTSFIFYLQPLVLTSPSSIFSYAPRLA